MTGADSFLEIERIAAMPDDVAAMEAFKAAAKDAHWKARDLGAVTMLSRAAIQFGLGRAREVEHTDPRRARALRRLVRAVAFNGASFTWPGWGVEGLDIEKRDVQAGLDAAQVCLRVALTLGDGPMNVARARWALGAHLLAAGRPGEARPILEQAAAEARGSAEPAEAVLYDGYVHLASMLGGDGAAAAAFQDALASLQRQGAEGAELAQQLRTAQRILQSASGDVA